MSALRAAQHVQSRSPRRRSSSARSGRRAREHGRGRTARNGQHRRRRASASSLIDTPPKVAHCGVILPAKRTVPVRLAAGLRPREHVGQAAQRQVRAQVLEDEGLRLEHLACRRPWSARPLRHRHGVRSDVRADLEHRCRHGGRERRRREPDLALAALAVVEDRLTEIDAVRRSPASSRGARTTQPVGRPPWRWCAGRRRARQVRRLAGAGGTRGAGPKAHASPTRRAMAATNDDRRRVVTTTVKKSSSECARHLGPAISRDPPIVWRPSSAPDLPWDC